MSEDNNSVAALRVRLDHHAATKSAAEAERARLIADRAEAGALLSEAELDAVDVHLARLAGVIERAGSRIELLRPALAAAEVREADTRRSDAAESVAFSDVARGALEAAGSGVVARGSMVDAIIGARAPAVSNYSAELFDERPAPRFSYGGDADWWEAHEARARAEGRAYIPRR